MTRRERSQIESLLGAAVAASVYDLLGTKASLAQFRRWARPNATKLGWVAVNVPEAEANRLRAAFSPVLKRFTNPDTGHIGFAVCDVIGGMEEEITLDRLTASMVKSAAILGPDTVVSAVLAWAGGDPGTYVTTWVLRGIELPEPLELRGRGIRFERLPDRGGDPYYGGLSPYLEGTGELLNKPVLRIDTTIDPMFYMPRIGEDFLDRVTRIRNTAIATPALKGLKLSKLLDALSLVCRSSVYSIYEWNEYPDEMLLMRHAAQTAPMTLNRPRFDSRSADALPLTMERLTHAMTAVGQMEGRSDLSVAVSRWKNSAVALDAANRVIDLRTVLESLYAQGVRQELTFRTALCGALHLAPTRAERLDYYRKLRDFYRLASHVVHGGKLVDKEGLVEWSYETCRRAILKRLEEPRKLDWTALMLGLHETPGEEPRP